MNENDKAYIRNLLGHAAKQIETERSSTVGPFTTFTFPLIRRTSPALIADSIVSVQPMTQPVGGIAFYMPRYGATAEPVLIVVGCNVRSRGGMTHTIVGTVLRIEERHTNRSITKVDHAIIETIEGHRVILPLSEIERVSTLDALAAATDG